MKICNNCGVELADFTVFCDACGARQPSAQRVSMPRAYQPIQRRTYQTSEGEGWDPIRLGVALLIIGFLVGFGVGAVTFNVLAGSGSQTTTTQRSTLTGLTTSPQQTPVTQTPFVTVTQTTPQTAVTTSMTTPVATTSMTTPVATAGWREIKRFTGSADMTTEPFNIPATMWRIRWSYSSPQTTSFSFFVYEVGQSAYVSAVSSYTLGASSVTNISKGQSNFYLSITTRANYEIIIEVPI
jgi:hypothetical protein